MVLAEEANSKSSAPAKKVLPKEESPSGKNVLHKVKLQLESLQKKINDVNKDTQKYVQFFILIGGHFFTAVQFYLYFDAKHYECMIDRCTVLVCQVTSYYKYRKLIVCCKIILFWQWLLTSPSEMYYCSKLYVAQESIDFPEQMRFVNLQRLLYGLQTVKLSTSVSLKDEQVLVLSHSTECKLFVILTALVITCFCLIFLLSAF